jgi:hypothetical protein
MAVVARFFLALMVIALAVGCAPPPDLAPRAVLDVSVRYPLESTSIPMGQALRCIVEVRDASGKMVPDARVVLTIRDAAGEATGSVEALIGSGDVYRSEGWTIPHRSEPGAWTVTAQAGTATAEGADVIEFQVQNSRSEELLQKYGFWVEDPSLAGIQTDLGRELGDAEDGAIIWGGVKVQQHIFKESWLEVRWRSGDFGLQSSEQVQDFMLDALGNLGFTPLRQLGEFERVKFKDWDAWQGTVRGQYTRFDAQWMIFYAPEADKTYAIGTTVVQAPTGIDPHETLRGSFEVHPEVDARGEAPVALPYLLPTPRQISPALGTRYMGAEEPIVLAWAPVKELVVDEYYRVKIDFDYKETNFSRYYATLETEFALPEGLYATPNCGVFNWQVTLMRQTGVGEDGQPIGEPISYDSLRWYVEWLYPLDAQAPFDRFCPNPQT